MISKRGSVMNTEKNLRVSVLLDYYSPMLTDKQKDVIDLYYNEDLSLSEIAEHENITRQGVRDIIVRAEATLLDYEERTGIVARFQQRNADIDRAEEIARSISESAKDSDIANMAEELTVILESLKG